MNNQKIGLDRCTFILTEGLQVDTNIYNMHLERGEKIEIIDRASGQIIALSDFDMAIKGIALNEKDDYKIKIRLIKTPKVCFVMDVNIPKIIYGTNERNVSNLESLADIPAIIEKELVNIGVFTDMSKAKITYLEVNINTEDEKVYGAMNLIRKAWNITDEKVYLTECKNVTESLMTQNRQVKIKLYDKVRQLRDTRQLCDSENLVRLELSTKHNEVIWRITKGRPTIDGLIENWDKLGCWFKKNIDKHIKKVCDAYIEQVVKEMTEELKTNKTYDVLLKQATKGNLIDIELFEKAVKQHYKECGKKSPYTMIRNTKKRLEKIDFEMFEQLQGNIKALNNLWVELDIK